MTKSEFAAGGMVFAMVAVLVVLAYGLFNMVRGRDTSGEKSNRLMWWRVYLQAIALGFFALVLYLAR